MYRHITGIAARLGAGGWAVEEPRRDLGEFGRAALPTRRGILSVFSVSGLPRRCRLGPTAGLLIVARFQVHAWCFVQVVNLGTRAEAKRPDRLSSNRTNDRILATNDPVFNRKPGARVNTICIAYRTSDGFVFFVHQVTLF